MEGIMQTCYCYDAEGTLCYRHDGAECIDCEHFSAEGREAHALAEEVERLRSVNAELLKALKRLVGNERRYEIPYDDYMQAVAAIGHAEGRE